jgi:hypothetical protein
MKGRVALDSSLELQLQLLVAKNFKTILLKVLHKYQNKFIYKLLINSKKMRNIFQKKHSFILS